MSANYACNETIVANFSPALRSLRGKRHKNGVRYRVSSYGTRYLTPSFTKCRLRVRQPVDPAITSAQGSAYSHPHSQPPPAVYLEQFDRIVAAIVPACTTVYGGRLRALAVFGSVARGTPRPDSDIDILIVADDLPAGRRARMTEFEHVDNLLEPLLAEARQQGVHTTMSPVPKTPAELAAGSLLFLDMVDEARILVDDAGTLCRFLDGLGARLAAAGARRVRKGGGYYWDLAPGYRWGDRIQL